MLVRNTMNRNVVTGLSSINIREASKVMTQYNIGSIILTDNDEVSGIVTSTNILKAIAEGKDPEETKVSEIMSKNVITIDPDKTIEDSVSLMLEHKIKKLPVVENKKLVGIITASDIISIEPKLIESIASLMSIKIPGYKGG